MIERAGMDAFLSSFEESRKLPALDPTYKQARGLESTALVDLHVHWYTPFSTDLASPRIASAISPHEAAIYLAWRNTRRHHGSRPGSNPSTSDLRPRSQTDTASNTKGRSAPDQGHKSAAVHQRLARRNP